MKLNKILTACLMSFGVLTSLNVQASGISIQASKNEIVVDVDDFLKQQKRIQRNTRFVDDSVANDVQMQVLADYAKQLAMQSAMRSGMSNISKNLKRYERQLDAIYNFQPLMIHSKVVPPVITEAVDLFNQNGDMQIRLTDRVYDIVQQARITSTPPNWRDYLQFSDEPAAFDDGLFMTSAMVPKSKIEKEIWEKATRDGWRLGIQQANTHLLESFDRLNRDYIGMIRFHTLVAEGKIDMPAISSYELYDNTDGVRLLMGEKLFQISSLPQFKKPTPDLKKIHKGNLAKEGFVQQREENMVDVKTDTPIADTIEQPAIKQSQNATHDAPVIDHAPRQSKVHVLSNTPYVQSVIQRRIIIEDNKK